MADSQRVRRIGELIQREIALLILREIKDPRLKEVTISGVKMNRDLSVARVYYTFLSQCETKLQQQEKQQSVQKGLNKANGFIRHHIGQELKLRIVPRLDFQFDTSIQHGAMMTELIDKVIAQDKEHTGNH